MSDCCDITGQHAKTGSALHVAGTAILVSFVMLFFLALFGVGDVPVLMATMSAFYIDIIMIVTGCVLVSSGITITLLARSACNK